VCVSFFNIDEVSGPKSVHDSSEDAEEKMDISIDVVMLFMVFWDDNSS
jgi:hypothetical protein